MRVDRVRGSNGVRVGWAVGGVRVGGGILSYPGQTCTCISGETTLFRGVVSRVGGRAEKSRGSSRKKEEKLSAISSFSSSLISQLILQCLTILAVCFIHLSTCTFILPVFKCLTTLSRQ